MKFNELSNGIRERLLMETAMEIKESYDWMYYSHEIDLDVVGDMGGSIEILSMFADWAIEFENTYYGTEAYEDDYIALIDEYAKRKIKETFTKTEKDE